MLELIQQHQFAAGIAALWLVSAAVGALPTPTAQSSLFYSWFFKFAKAICGDLGSTFGKYLPGAGTAAMIALLCWTLVFAPVIGCTQAQRVDVAQEIVNWTPALTSAIDTAGAVVDSLDPITSPIVNTLVGAVNVLNPQFVTAAKSYLANPSQSTLQVLQGIVVQIQNSVNSSLALLQAAKVNNPTSQAKAKSAINGIATVVNALLALVESVSTKAQVAAMSRDVTVRLAVVRPMLDENAMQLASARVATDLRMPAVTVDRYFDLQAQAGF